MKFHLLVLINLTKIEPEPLQLHCILTGTAGADAFPDQVHFLKPELLRKGNLRYTGFGQAEGLPADFTIEMHMQVMMRMGKAIILATGIFHRAGPVVNLMDQAILLKGFQGAVQGDAVGPMKISLQII